MGGWKSWIWFAGTAGPRNNVSHMCVKVPCCATGPVLSLHHAVIRCRTAKRDAVSLMVGAHARKGAAASDATFEVVDMRGFEVRASRLIVAAVLIQPGNRIRIGAAVRSHRLLINNEECPEGAASGSMDNALDFRISRREGVGANG